MSLRELTDVSPEAQLSGFLAKFNPDVAAIATEARAKMRALLPGATELVYDNYNALAIGYAPREKTSEGVFSLAVYPRWVSLFFLKAQGLRDGSNVLKGSGKVVRHIVLKDASTLDDPAVRELMEQALKLHPIDATNKPSLIIKSISAKQRPRRPAH